MNINDSEQQIGLSDDEINELIEELDKPAQIKELVYTYNKMIKDRDSKCIAAKEQLIENLKITADKYRTGTGVMEALRMIRMVNDGRPEDMAIYDEIECARDMAAAMIVEISELTQKVEKLGFGEMDKICDGHYNKDFISMGISANDLVLELMRLDLCRNVGPAGEDIVSFIDRTQEEIEAICDKLDELDPNWMNDSSYDIFSED